VGDLGERIYAAAYAKLGKLYWWGKSGPDYFDCSGLVYWSLKQAGVSGGRGTAASYSQKWSAVSFNNSQTGDLVCFGSPAYHIGIVIVNGDGSRSMIHAGGGDSSTHGNDPDAKVKISSIEPGSYYYSRISTIRRVS
ncbi:MAG: C40 family peptidase, partial [Thomasclavelia spiroformis]